MPQILNQASGFAFDVAFDFTSNIVLSLSSTICFIKVDNIITAVLLNCQPAIEFVDNSQNHIYNNSCLNEVFFLKIFFKNICRILQSSDKDAFIVFVGAF